MDERKRGDPSAWMRQTAHSPSEMNRPHAPASTQGCAPRQARPSAMEQAQTPALDGFKPLSREERDEAARIALEAGFSFDGYQVVRREFFSHRYDPTLTIRGNSIIFNNTCISRLDQVVYVQILVNPITRKLVIRPCAEGARDAIRWCVIRDDKRRSRQISCGLFAAKLYDMMGWEAVYRYKLQGMRINYQGEQLYAFDLTSAEAFLPQTREVDAEGKPRRKRAVPMYPADWRDSFGMPVAEHAASAQIHLLEGYERADSAPGISERKPAVLADPEMREETRV